MSAAHTPGPWRAVSYGRRGTSWLIEQADGEQSYVAHADGEHPNITDEQAKINEADARLIAAAPDLLAAIVAYRTSGRTVPGRALCEQMDAAVAKATGGDA